jgi:hypothetical protein
VYELWQLALLLALVENDRWGDECEEDMVAASGIMMNDEQAVGDDDDGEGLEDNGVVLYDAL